jgi:hypothetical protein
VAAASTGPATSTCWPKRANALRAASTVVVVVVAWLHRLGRKVSERVRCWEELDALGVAIHSGPRALQSKLVHDILASVAEEESRQIGERVQAVWTEAARNGWFEASHMGAAWGYLIHSATDDERRRGAPKTVVDVDPERAPYAPQTFDRIARGESMNNISACLNPTPGDPGGCGRHGRRRRAIPRYHWQPPARGRP